MTPEQLVALLTAALTVIGAGLRWAVKLWATVRRESVEAQKVMAAQQRADSERMIEALLAQARSNERLAGQLDQLTDRLDRLFERDLDDSQRRRRTPHGSPVPRNGTDD